jgi:hypothetical protein
MHYDIEGGCRDKRGLLRPTWSPSQKFQERNSNIGLFFFIWLRLLLLLGRAVLC